ncbi:YraN family protein [Alterinioella nitratireducens]|uniref:YraN family protein n=1 Tax=Alterinioella nitratireducens TaxID=2735915 RepID=UPI004058736B
MSGKVSYLAGLSAEDQVARDYARSGHVILSRRWRGAGGEIDLVVERDGVVIFIEVKKSRDHARAAERLSQRQLRRIFLSAEDYIGTLPDGANTNARVDVALLDAQGRICILDNVMCA